jgi:hypothetical protein
VSSWFRHGLLNTSEHVLTRLADAGASLLILTLFAPERLGTLAWAQAWVAPLLFLALSPETILYRDYSVLKAGGSLAHFVRAFQRFAELKVLALTALALGTAAVLGRSTEELWALLWALSLPLGAQLLGPERETLRLGLELKRLNQLTLIQKFLFFGATLLSAMAFKESNAALAAAVWASFALSLVLARTWVRRVDRGAEASRGTLPSFGQIWRSSLQGFSGAQHLIGVCLGWVQTLDLFFLSWVATDARTLGLYSVVLKIANFSNAVPIAVANLYAIRLGRARADLSEEKQQLKKLSFGFALGVGVQCLLGVALGGFALRLLSRGRWTELENAELHGWLVLILLGAAWYQLPLLHNAWLVVRSSLAKVLTQIFVPWLLLAAAIYGWIAILSPRQPGAMAAANVLVGAIFLALVGLRFYRQARLAR